jgi:PEP-CTERM motif
MNLRFQTSLRSFVLLLGLASIAIPRVTHAIPITFSAAGVNPAAIQAQVNAFRGNLGALNPNVVGSFGSGRREINWDGVPNVFSAPNNLPANFFNVNSPRGAVFSSSAGSAFQVSANDGIAPVLFGNIEPAYADFFTTFSQQRLFTALGTNIYDVSFFVPGSTTPALTRAFGSVFTDVDNDFSTSIEYFDVANASLGKYFVPNVQGDKTLSFLGVAFDSPVVSRVRVTSGSQILAAGNTSSDLVVADDFIYAEPIAVPEPASLAIFGLGSFGFCTLSRRRKFA